MCINQLYYFDNIRWILHDTSGAHVGKCVCQSHFESTILRPAVLSACLLLISDKIGFLVAFLPPGGKTPNINIDLVDMVNFHFF